MLCEEAQKRQSQCVPSGAVLAGTEGSAGRGALFRSAISSRGPLIVTRAKVVTVPCSEGCAAIFMKMSSEIESVDVGCGIWFLELS